MLANYYIPELAAAHTAIGFFALVILLEAPLAAVIWRGSVVRTIGWVALANIASTLVGVMPVLLRSWMHAAGMYANPWEVYCNAVPQHLLRLGIAFFVSLLIEGFVYVALNHFSKQRISLRRLLAALLLMNIASYGALAFYVVASNYRARDFTLLADTKWLATCDKRAWFVDPDSAQLFSNRLDGNDRRLEIAEPLGRFRAQWHPVSLYAIIPDKDAILFVTPRRDWRIVENGVARTLATAMNSDLSEFSLVREAPDVFPLAYKEAFGAAPTMQSLVWASFAERADHPMRKGDRANGYEVFAFILLQDGTGSGLLLRDPSGQPRRFGIASGIDNLACDDPAILPDSQLVVFRCGGWVMVMDPKSLRVGQLSKGDSLVALAPAFDFVRARHRAKSGELNEELSQIVHK